MQKVFLILFVGILAVFVGHKAMKSSIVMDDVVLKNMEALASGESSGIPWQGFLYNWKAGCCERHNPYAECSGAYTAC